NGRLPYRLLTDGYTSACQRSPTTLAPCHSGHVPPPVLFPGFPLKDCGNDAPYVYFFITTTVISRCTVFISCIPLIFHETFDITKLFVLSKSLVREAGVDCLP